MLDIVYTDMDTHALSIDNDVYMISMNRAQRGPAQDSVSCRCVSHTMRSMCELAASNDHSVS